MIYEENKRVIENLRSNLRGIINENLRKSENKSDIDGIKSIQTREEINSLEILKGGETFRLNSFYRPLSEATNWVEALDLKGIGKVISVFGFGNGLYIRKLLEKIENQELILVYEPSVTIFKYVIEHFNLKDILEDKRVLIYVVGINENEYRKNLQDAVYWSNLFSQRRFVLPQYDRAFPDEYETFINIIKGNNDRTIMLRNTDSLFGRIVVDNTFENLKYLKNCNILSDFIGQFPDDVPAIIVSAGPSLDKNIETLKNINKRAVIFGVDRSLEYLYRRGIEPDYAVTIDPLKPLKYFAKDYDVKVPLFAELHSNQEILNIHDGKKIFFNAFGYINTILDKFNKTINPLIASGTSVATAAFALCITMKFKRIILIGQDLAYSDVGNSTHAGGINTEETKYEDIFVEGVNGNKVRTRYDWIEFIHWFGDTIEEHPEVEVIDATEGGAKIRGTKVMTLREAIDTYCIKEFDCSSLNKGMKSTFTEKEIKEIIDYLVKSKADLTNIKKKAHEAILACDKMIQNCKKHIDENKSSQNLLKKITKANKYITNKPIYSMLDSYITESTSSNMRDIYQVSENNMEDKITTFTQGREVYEQIESATDEIINLMESKEVLDTLGKTV